VLADALDQHTLPHEHEANHRQQVAQQRDHEYRHGPVVEDEQAGGGKPAAAAADVLREKQRFPHGQGQVDGVHPGEPALFAAHRVGAVPGALGLPPQKLQELQRTFASCIGEKIRTWARVCIRCSLLRARVSSMIRRTATGMSISRRYLSPETACVNPIETLAGPLVLTGIHWPVFCQAHVSQGANTAAQPTSKARAGRTRATTIRASRSTLGKGPARAQRT
jgi:hypothetical protein